VTRRCAARPRYDPWRDTRDAPIPVHCRVEQIGVAKEYGALASRMHKQGEVVDRRGARLRVLFDGEDTPVSIRPHLVRVLTADADPPPPPSAERIIAQLHVLLPVPAEDGDHGR
jgi:hypothetical protein